MAAKRGRPIKYHVDEIIKIIDEYTKITELPILKEVCYINDWDYQVILNLSQTNSDLNYFKKRLLYKKEIELERGGLMGKYEKTMTIFSLKQLGWRDKPSTDDLSDALQKLDDILKNQRNLAENE